MGRKFYSVDVVVTTRVFVEIDDAFEPDRSRKEIAEEVALEEVGGCTHSSETDFTEELVGEKNIAAAKRHADEHVVVKA